VRRWDEARQRAASQGRWQMPWQRRPAPPELDLRTWPAPLNMTNYYSLDERRALFHGAAEHDSLDVLRADVARVGASDPLHQALYVYCQGWLVEDLLMKADRMSMGNSLELRTPFLDYRLVEWAARAPASLKVGTNSDGGYQTKRVLREFAQGLVPEAVLSRPKMGFPVPVYDWLSGRLSNWARDLLCGTECMLRRWLNNQGIVDAVQRGTAPSAPTTDRHRLWNLIVLELWMREWQPT
jgi:asparagine synthase (glutamine-hydrolysing)